MPLTIKQRKPGGNYYIRGTVAGRSIYQSSKTTSKALANKLRFEIEERILSGLSASPPKIATFAQAAETYLISGGEARFLGPITEYFGAHTTLSEIDNARVSEAALEILPNAQPSTINRQIITPISAVVNLAAEDGLCPARKFRRRKVTAKKTRWLTPEEFALFEAELSNHLKPILGFMIGTGARVRETLSLSISTLYLNTGEALLTDTKNDKSRMVRFPEKSKWLILGADLPAKGQVFRNQYGRPYSILKNTGGQIKTPFDRARIAAGLGPDVTPHTIRHTWATWYYAQTLDFGGLLDLGGWSGADVANIYRKIAPADLSERLFAHGWDFTNRTEVPKNGKIGRARLGARPILK